MTMNMLLPHVTLGLATGTEMVGEALQRVMLHLCLTPSSTSHPHLVRAWLAHPAQEGAGFYTPQRY